MRRLGQLWHLRRPRGGRVDSRVLIEPPRLDRRISGALHGQSAAGHGVYTRDSFSVRLDNSPDSDLARVVSVHEMFHATLDERSSWGTLLHILAAAEAASLDPERWNKLLVAFVDACRRTHEAFATYLSVWTVDPVAGPALLSSAAGYQQYYDAASALCPHWSHASPLSQAAVQAGLRSCCQAPVDEVALQVGLENLTLSQVRGVLQPDVRRRMLARTDGRWCESALPAIRDRCVNEAQIDPTLVTPEWHPGRVGDLDRDDIARLAEIAAEEFYASAAGTLESMGAATLDYDGHQRTTARLIEELERVEPGSRGWLIASPTDDTSADRAAAVFERERLVLRDPGLVAVVQSQAVPPQPDGFITGSGSDRHLFVVARSPQALRAQYRVVDAGTSLPHDGSPIVAVRTLLSDGRELPGARVAFGESMVLLAEVGSPSELRRLAHRSSVPLVASVSMSVLQNVSWFRKWIPDLCSDRGLSVLFDLPPLRHFELWRQTHETLRYSLAQHDIGHGPRSVFVCLTSFLPDVPFLAICTQTAAQSFASYLRDTTPGFADRDDDLIREHARVIHLTVDHLLREDAYFSFDWFHA